MVRRLSSSGQVTSWRLKAMQDVCVCVLRSVMRLYKNPAT